jgi:hypothetical protein
MTRKLPLQVRIDPALEGALKKLAKANRRSLTSEVNAIIASTITTKKGT